MSIEIRNIFDITREKTPGGGKRITEQAHLNELDVNQIVARAKKTGMIRQTAAVALYGDFSNVHDFFSAQNFLRQAQRDFMDLPPKVRGYFHNSPGKLLEFMADEKNRDKAIELGLIEKPKNQPEISKDTTAASAPGNPTL